MREINRVLKSAGIEPKDCLEYVSHSTAAGGVLTALGVSNPMILSIVASIVGLSVVAKTVHGREKDSKRRDEYEKYFAELLAGLDKVIERTAYIVDQNVDIQARLTALREEVDKKGLGEVAISLPDLDQLREAVKSLPSLDDIKVAVEEVVQKSERRVIGEIQKLKADFESAISKTANTSRIIMFDRAVTTTFFGRARDLDGIDQGFQDGSRLALTQQVYGGMGVGKTTLAAYYLMQSVVRDPNLDAVWIDAETASSRANSLTNLGSRLPAEAQKDDPVEAAKDWLTGVRSRSLLVVMDNVNLEDANDVFTLAAGIKGRVLVTTRQDHDVEGWDKRQVGVLDHEAAENLLLERFYQRETYAESEREAATALATMFGCLPLLLEQAAAYAKVKRIGSLTKLREIWPAVKANVLATKPALGANIHKDIYATVMAVFNALTEQNPAAAQLASAMAWLDPEATGTAFFLMKPEALPNPLGTAIAQGGLDDLCALGHDLALFEWRAAKSVVPYPHLTMHRATQEVLRLLPYNHLARVAPETLAASVSTPTWEEFAYIAKVAPLLDSLTALSEHTVEIVTVDLLIEIGKVANLIARFSLAKDVFEQALTINKRHGGRNYQTSRILNGLGYVFQCTGRLADSESLFRDSLELSRKLLGAKHIDTLSCMNNLANLLHAVGRFSEAEPLLTECLRMSRVILGDLDPMCLATMSNLAMLYASTGRLVLAEQLYLKAAEVSDEVLGEYHFGTITTLNNLAQLYKTIGRLSESETFTRTALWRSQAGLGDGDPVTFGTMHNLAGILSATGRFAEAEPLYLQALNMCREVIGEKHPNTIACSVHLARLYEATGREAEALEMFRAVLPLAQALPEGVPIRRAVEDACRQLGILRD